MSVPAVCNLCGAKGKLKVREVAACGRHLGLTQGQQLSWLTDGQYRGGRQLCTTCRSVGYCR
jgi:hypothetical protein